jgi:hypothetical protein
MRSSAIAPLILALTLGAGTIAEAAAPPPGAAIIGYRRDKIPLYSETDEALETVERTKLPSRVPIVDIKENGLLGFVYGDRKVYVLRSMVIHENVDAPCLAANLPTRRDGVAVAAPRMGGGASLACKDTK